MKLARRFSMAITPLVLLSTSAAAQPAGGGDWMWNSGWGWGGMMIGSGLMMLVFWGGIILLIVLLARGFGGTGSARQPEQPRPTALEILKERYARGEIDKQEYDDRRKTLSG